MADGAVTNPKLATGSVLSTNIGAGAVATPNIADQAITTPKIAPGAVSISVIERQSAGVAVPAGSDAFDSVNCQQGEVPTGRGGGISGGHLPNLPHFDVSKMDNETGEPLGWVAGGFNPSTTGNAFLESYVECATIHS